MLLYWCFTVISCEKINFNDIEVEIDQSQCKSLSENKIFRLYLITKRILCIFYVIDFSQQSFENETKQEKRKKAEKSGEFCFEDKQTEWENFLSLKCEFWTKWITTASPNPNGNTIKVGLNTKWDKVTSFDMIRLILNRKTNWCHRIIFFFQTTIQNFE